MVKQSDLRHVVAIEEEDQLAEMSTYWSQEMTASRFRACLNLCYSFSKNKAFWKNALVAHGRVIVDLRCTWVFAKAKKTRFTDESTSKCTLRISTGLPCCTSQAVTTSTDRCDFWQNKRDSHCRTMGSHQSAKLLARKWVKEWKSIVRQKKMFSKRLECPIKRQKSATYEIEYRNRPFTDRYY